MKINFKIVGMLLNEETADVIRNSLVRIDGVDMSFHFPESGWTLDNIGTDEMPDLFVYELSGDSESEVENIENLVTNFGDKLPIFVTYKEGDISTIRRLMRAGIKDVFPQPIQANELAQSVITAISEKRKRIKETLGGKGGVTAFLNAKGGTGASTIAVNVAHMLAKKHKAEVALIDLDVQFGSAAMQLDLHPKNNVLEALLQPDRVDPVFLKALMTPHDSGLEVLASPADLSPIEGIHPDAVTRLLSAAAERYDYVILDVPRLYMPWVVAAIKFADPVMLVCENNLATIRDAKLLLDRMAHEGVSFANIELVNNRAMSKQTSVSIEQLKETLGKNQIRRVRNDYKTALHAQDQGRPVYDVARKSHLAEDVKAIADYIVEQHAGGKTKSRHGLFGWLFSH